APLVGRVLEAGAIDERLLQLDRLLLHAEGGLVVELGGGQTVLAYRLLGARDGHRGRPEDRGDVPPVRTVLAASLTGVRTLGQRRTQVGDESTVGVRGGRGAEHATGDGELIRAAAVGGDPHLLVVDLDDVADGEAELLTGSDRDRRGRTVRDRGTQRR